MSDTNSRQHEYGLMQMNTSKIIHLNCGERYKDIDDYRSYIHNFSSCDQLIELSSQLGAYYELTI